MKLLVFLNFLFCLNQKPDNGEKTKLHLLILKPGVKIEMIDQLIKRKNNVSKIIELNIIEGFKLYDYQPNPDFILRAKALDISEIRKKNPIYVGYAGYFEIGNSIVLVYPKKILGLFSNYQNQLKYSI